MPVTPEEIPHILKTMEVLRGATITKVWNERDGFYGFDAEKGNDLFVVVVRADGEGNGPGFLRVVKVDQ